MRFRLGGKNYKAGASFEGRWLNQLLFTGKAKRGRRFFRSTGPRWKRDYTRMNEKGTDYAWIYAPVDVWWIDEKNNYNEDQCKIGTANVGRIDEEEFLNLVMYSWENPDITVSLVSKQKNKKHTHVWTLNDKVIV